MGQSLAEYPLPEENKPMKVSASELDSVVLISKGYESDDTMQDGDISSEVQGLAEKLGVKESSVESLLTPLFMQDSYPMPDGEEPMKVEAGELEYVVLAPKGYEGYPQTEGGMQMTEEDEEVTEEDQNMSEDSQDQELSEMKEEVKKMTQKSEELKLENEQLSEKVEEYENSVSDYEEKVEQLEQEKQELQDKVDEYEEMLEQKEKSEKRQLAEDIMEIREKKGLVDEDCDCEQKLSELTEMPKDALKAILQDLKEVSEKLSEPQPKVKENVEEEEHKNSDEKKEALRKELFGDRE